jgi:hypothetical protein
MEFEMTLHDELYTRRRQKPFQPFRIVATDGRSVEVTEPFMFGFNELFVLVAKATGASWRARYSEIASIEPLKTAS